MWQIFVYDEAGDYVAEYPDKQVVCRASTARDAIIAAWRAMKLSVKRLDMTCRMVAIGAHLSASRRPPDSLFEAPGLNTSA